MLVDKVWYQLGGGYHTRQTAQVMSRRAVQNEPPGMTSSLCVYE